MSEEISPPVKDIVPEGAFFGGDYDPVRIAALKKIIEIGNRVSGESPQVAEMYKDTNLTYLEIAEQIIPEEVSISAGVAARAIGFAIRNLLPEEEVTEITARRRALNLEKQKQAMGEEGFRAHQQAASRKRHELHGVDVAAMLEGRGRIAWTDDEKRVVHELCKQKDFQHDKGSIAGTPNYSTIAFVINELFHDGKEIRYGNSVGSLVRDSRRNKS